MIGSCVSSQEVIGNAVSAAVFTTIAVLIG